MPRKRKDTAAEVQSADPYEGLSDDNHNDFAAELLTDAVDLQKEKEGVMKRIDANRQALRLVKGTGHVSEKQAKAVDLLYPLRTKKDAETTETPAEEETPAEDPAEETQAAA